MSDINFNLIQSDIPILHKYLYRWWWKLSVLCSLMGDGLRHLVSKNKMKQEERSNINALVLTKYII